MPDQPRPLSDRDAQTLERMAKALADWDKPVDHVERFAGKGFANMKPGPRRHGNYAYFPGTGPGDMTCWQCRFLDREGKYQRCGKFKRLTGRRGEAIQASAVACKFFQIAGGK